MTEQPGTPPAQPGDAATPGVPAAPEQPKSQSMGKRILFSVVGVVVVFAVGFVVRAIIADATGDPRTAEVGDCFDNHEDINDIKIVDCDSEEAFWEVASVNKNFTENEFAAAPFEELCPTLTHPESTAFWFGEDKTDGEGNGDVFCTAPIAGSP